LCQFRAASGDDARSWVADFLARGIDVVPTGFAIRPGQEKHTGKFWVEHIVAMEETLLSLQEDIVAALQRKSPEVMNKTRAGYYPHFTFARISSPDIQWEPRLLDSKLMRQPVACRVSLGLCDENGQFLKEI